MKLYQGSKQYKKADLWKAIKTTMSEIEPAEVKKINKINGLLAIIEKKGYNIKM